MSKPMLGNPQNTIEVIQKYEFKFQKKFGQNFLIDTHVVDKIIRSAGLTKDDMVLEIGPGIGSLTQHLAENAGKVVAVEIDRTGKVLSAEVTYGGDECMRQTAIESARNSRFDHNDSAPPRQKGKITYIFIPQ